MALRTLHAHRYPESGPFCRPLPRAVKSPTVRRILPMAPLCPVSAKPLSQQCRIFQRERCSRIISSFRCSIIRLIFQSAPGVSIKRCWTKTKAMRALDRVAGGPVRWSRIPQLVTSYDSNLKVRHARSVNGRSSSMSTLMLRRNLYL
jgi:hypothetical protein